MEKKTTLQIYNEVEKNKSDTEINYAWVRVEDVKKYIKNNLDKYNNDIIDTLTLIESYIRLFNELSSGDDKND